MPVISAMPTTGRARWLSFLLNFSSFGWPVAGSFGSRSETMVPQNASPQRAMRTRALPPSVIHMPVGSAEFAGDARTKKAAAQANVLFHIFHLLRSAAEHAARKLGLHERVELPVQHPI